MTRINNNTNLMMNEGTLGRENEMGGDIAIRVLNWQYKRKGKKEETNLSVARMKCGGCPCKQYGHYVLQ